MAKRKTFEVSAFVDMCNKVLSDEEFLDRDKAIISAVLESVLLKTENEFSFTGKGFSRKYEIKE